MTEGDGTRSGQRNAAVWGGAAAVFPPGALRQVGSRVFPFTRALLCFTSECLQPGPHLVPGQLLCCPATGDEVPKASWWPT